MMDLQARAVKPSLFVSLWTVFTLTLRQLLRGRRLLILCCLFALPAVLALIARSVEPPAPTKELEFVLLLNFLPVGLLPLTCLLNASGLVQDEIEEQTLTYLLIRPIPRALLYTARLLATLVVVFALTAVFVTITACCVWWNSTDLTTVGLPHVVLLLAILLPVTLTYTTFFGLLSLYVQRLLVVGIFFIVMFEYFLANIDFVMRKFTVFFHFRVLVLNWIEDSHQRNWSIPLQADTTPSASESLAMLLLGSATFLILGMLRFRNGEYKVKTPGES